jgi:hypothetical protein
LGCPSGGSHAGVAVQKSAAPALEGASYGAALPVSRNKTPSAVTASLRRSLYKLRAKWEVIDKVLINQSGRSLEQDFSAPVRKFDLPLPKA